jgi:hypothetical protein
VLNFAAVDPRDLLIQSLQDSLQGALHNVSSLQFKLEKSQNNLHYNPKVFAYSGCASCLQQNCTCSHKAVSASRKTSSPIRNSDSDMMLQFGTSLKLKDLEQTSGGTK